MSSILILGRFLATTNIWNVVSLHHIMSWTLSILTLKSCKSTRSTSCHLYFLRRLMDYLGGHLLLVIRNIELHHVAAKLWLTMRRHLRYHLYFLHIINLANLTILLSRLHIKHLVTWILLASGAWHLLLLLHLLHLLISQCVTHMLHFTTRTWHLLVIIDIVCYNIEL